MFPMELLKERRRANWYATYRGTNEGLFLGSSRAVTRGGALGVGEEEGGSRGPRLFITNVTSRWDLATPHPGRYLFPRWKEPEVEDGKHGQLEHKLECPPWAHFGLFKKGTTPGESAALITLSSLEEFHRRTAKAKNSWAAAAAFRPRLGLQHCLFFKLWDPQQLTNQPWGEGKDNEKTQRKGNVAACRSNFPELHFPPKDWRGSPL